MTLMDILSGVLEVYLRTLGECYLCLIAGLGNMLVMFVCLKASGRLGLFLNWFMPYLVGFDSWLYLWISLTGFGRFECFMAKAGPLTGYACFWFKAGRIFLL